MPPDIAGGLVGVLGVVSVGILVLVGMRIRFTHKMQGQNRTNEFEQITDVLDALQEQTHLLREDVSELQERLDFHDRLLTQPRHERVDTPA
jgi:hypothetical protein